MECVSWVVVHSGESPGHSPKQCWVVGNSSLLSSAAFCCKRNHRQMEKLRSEECQGTEAIWEHVKMPQMQRKPRRAKTETKMPSQCEPKLKISPTVTEGLIDQPLQMALAHTGTSVGLRCKYRGTGALAGSVRP